jgi:hypothetical protein
LHALQRVSAAEFRLSPSSPDLFVHALALPVSFRTFSSTPPSTLRLTAAVSFLPEVLSAMAHGLAHVASSSALRLARPRPGANSFAKLRCLLDISDRPVLATSRVRPSASLSCSYADVLVSGVLCICVKSPDLGLLVQKVSAFSIDKIRS